MALSEAEVLTFRRHLPRTYGLMKFYAIFPNGTKVLLTDISAQMLANPELRPMKFSEGGIPERGAPIEAGPNMSRLILVIEMTTPNPDGSETLYARQGFYLSTGSNSNMPNTWLPCDGISWSSTAPPPDRPLPPSFLSIPRLNYPFVDELPPGPEGKRLLDELWLYKAPFTWGINEARFNKMKHADDPHKYIKDLYHGSFLPEGEMQDRLGPFSHIIASYILGGGAWERGGPYYRAPYDIPEHEMVGVAELNAAMIAPRPANPDFVFLNTNPDAIPANSVTEINAYLSRFGALSYMNGFVNTGVVLPTLMDYSVVVVQEDRRAALPPAFLLEDLANKLYTVMIGYRAGVIPSDTASLTTIVADQIKDVGVVRLNPAPPGFVPWRIQDYIDRFVFEASRRSGVLYGGRRKKTYRKKVARHKTPRKARKSKKNMRKL